MEREYKAFISYRHLPLDTEIAKKMHRRIEHYIIPRALRKDGKKKLGYVFRDQDELPTSSDLSSNIQTALDHSEYLIVICSPETNNSVWVRSEIRYFLKHHDRDHVLAVLADGRPEESFPSELTDILAEDGTVLDHIEPMAANLALGSKAKRDRAIGVESLRILAPLIGCSFDELYRREQRYKLQRIGIAAGAAAAIAAAFIAILLNRNAEIQANYEQALRNQSEFFATESLKLLEEGDRLSAISLAIAALPSETQERPLVSRAEYALGTAVNAYSLPNNASWNAAGALHHLNPVREFQLNADKSLLATRTDTSVISCWDTQSMQKLWDFPMVDNGGLSSTICGFLKDNRLIAWSSAAIYCLKGDDGELLWSLEREQLSGNSWANISKTLLASEKEILLAYTYDKLLRIDAASGTVLADYPEPSFTVEDQEIHFDFTRMYLSPDGEQLAFLFEYGRYDGSKGGIAVMNLTDGSIRTAYSGLSGEEYFYLPRFIFPDPDHLVFSLNEKNYDSYIAFNVKSYSRSYDVLNCLNLETGELEWQNRHEYFYPGVDVSLSYRTSVNNKPYLVYCFSNRAAFVELSTGAVLGTVEFTAPVIRMQAGGDFFRFLLSNGSVAIIDPPDFNRWTETQAFTDDLSCADSGSSGFWVLKDGSTDVIHYSHSKPDEAWTAFEIDWDTPEDAVFFPDERYVRDDCVAFIEDNILLLSNGDPEEPLREVKLPGDSERYWVTSYSPACHENGVFYAFWSDGDMRETGVIAVDMHTLDYRRTAWDNGDMQLLWLFCFDDNPTIYALTVQTSPTSSENGGSTLFACVLDHDLNVVRQMPITENWDPGCSSDIGSFGAEQLCLFVPEKQEAFYVNFRNSRVRECPKALTEVFASVTASGRSLRDAVRWSPDGTVLAVKTAENRLEIRDASGALRAEIAGETTEIESFSFTPDAKQLLTVENDSSMRRYRADDGTLLGMTELFSYSRHDSSKIEWNFTDNGFLALNMEKLMNLISMEDWGVCAYAVNCVGYLEDSDFFYCQTYQNSGFGLGGFHRYSEKELIAIGEEILNGWELSENQKLHYGLAQSNSRIN